MDEKNKNLRLDDDLGLMVVVFDGGVLDTSLVVMWHLISLSSGWYARMSLSAIEPLKWLTESQVRSFASGGVQLPVYVYSESVLRHQIQQALSFPVNEGFGFQARFALKANPNRTILNIMRQMGIAIDAGSHYEVLRAIHAGYEPHEIQLTAQELAPNLVDLVSRGVHFNACSLHQLEEFGKNFPGKEVGARFNPGVGSGGCTKTNVGGATSAFGIWHEKMDQVKNILEKYSLKLTTVHTHIGSGTEPEVWKEAAALTLDIAAQFPECTTVNLGGGFKIARMSNEHSSDLQSIGQPVKKLFKEFAEKHGRKLKLEIEPGSLYTVTFGAIIAKVDDIIDTGDKGYNFIKLNTGMDAITRPSLYGARHPIIIIPKEPREQVPKSYVVSGHCCESGDLLTQTLGGDLEERTLGSAEIGDYAVIEGSGAYCSSMSTKNYNSFPELAEYLLQLDGTFKMIRKAATIEQIIQNEL